VTEESNTKEEAKQEIRRRILQAENEDNVHPKRRKVSELRGDANHRHENLKF
jgi:hypothetical protein